MRYCFTVDDNIRFLKEIAEHEYGSIFEHPYAAMLKRLHERFDTKIQLNLFYRTAGFDLSKMPVRYRDEWAANADWLKLSFHADHENENPYADAAYDTVFADCARVQREILRFAGEETLAATTTVHYCQTTTDGVKALADNGVKGLLGLYGTAAAPMTSYSVPLETAARIRAGEVMVHGGVTMAAINMIINTLPYDALLPVLGKFEGREELHVMIHEQYFYTDYAAYQADFEKKLVAVLTWLSTHDYRSVFFEECV